MTTGIEPLITVADLDNYPDDGNRYELIGGRIFVSGAPDISHQLILRDVLFEIAIYLKERPIGRVVPGVGTILSNYDLVIPDIAFVRSERWNEIASGEWLAGAPDLIVEVLSLGVENRERDLQIKRQLYAKYGVMEYWVIDCEDKSVLVFRLRGEMLEKMATVRGKDKITTYVLPSFDLEVSAIFRSTSVSRYKISLQILTEKGKD